MANTPLMEMPVDEFLAALDEFKTMDPSTDIDFLKREYDRVNSLTGEMNAEVDEGRTGLAGNFLSKEEETTGWDAISSLQFEPRAGATGVAQGVEQALTAPGRAARGTMPVQDTTMEALGTAGMAMTGGLTAAGKGIGRVDEDTMGIFGTRGERVDNNRFEAAQMKQAGASDDLLWEDMGVQFNPTNRQWEQEFDSSQMRIASKGAPEASEQRVASRLWQDAEELADVYGGENQQAIPLGEVVRFDELFAVYPELEDVALTFKPGDGASYDRTNNMLTMGLETLQDPDTFSLNLNKFKDVLVHEVQHAVQNVDSTAPGSNPDWFARQVPKLKEDLLAAENLRDSVDALPLSIERSFARLGEESPYYAEFGEEFRESLRNPSEELQRARRLETDVNKEAFRLYEATEGEIQSRAAEMRRYMTAEERAETPPSHTYRMALNRELDRYRSDVRDGVKQNYAEGGLVADVSNNAMADYFKAASGMMSEAEFVGKHKVSTKDFEDRFEENNNVDISGAESFKDITGTTKGDNMPKRMNFNEGGMAVPVDPVSGNEIPLGSSAENVRDDVPAMLSEGEYVVPADVVRFFGVNFFEQLRDKAKGDMQEMVADNRVGGNDPQQENMQVDPEMVQAVTQMAEGGLIDSGNINQLIDKVLESAKTNPELQGIFQKRGIMMAEGGLVTGEQTEGTFNAADWQNVGGSYGVGSGGGFEYVPYTGANGSTMMVLHINGVPAQTIPEGFSSGKASSGINPNAGPGTYSAPTPQRNDKDQSINAAQLYAQQGPSGQGVAMGEAGGALANFNSPLDGLDFNDSQSVVEHFSGRLAPDALKAKLSPNLGLSAVSGAVNMGREARRVAETRAAAMAADAAGNEELAANLREMAQTAHDEYGLGGIMGLIPEEMMDGDRIYEGYVQKQQRLAEEGEVQGRSAATGTGANTNGMQSVSRDTPAGARPISGGVVSATPLVRNNDGDGHRTVTDVGGVTYKQTSNSDDPNTYSSRTAVGSTAPTTSARPQARPMNKGGLVQRRY